MATSHHIAGVPGIWRLNSFQESPHAGRRHTQKGNKTTRQTGGRQEPTRFHESGNIPLKIFTGGIRHANAKSRGDKRGTKDEPAQIQRRNSKSSELRSFPDAVATGEVGEAAADGGDLRTPTPSPAGAATQGEEPKPHSRHGET